MKSSLVLVLTLLFSVLAICVEKEAVVSYPLDSKLKEFPKGCMFSKANPCLLRTNFHHKFRYNNKLGQISLGSDSAIMRRGEKDFHFISGEIWWQGSGEIATEFGNISCKDCEVYMFRTIKQVTVRALSGKITLIPKGSEERLEVPQFTENWMGGVYIKKGHAQTGIPSPLSLRKHLRKWAQFYVGDKAEFKEKVQKFRRKWADVVHETAKAYKSMSTRRLATVTKKRKQKKAAKKKRLDEDKVFRDMLRRRALTE